MPDTLINPHLLTTVWTGATVPEAVAAVARLRGHRDAHPSQRWVMGETTRDGRKEFEVQFAGIMRGDELARWQDIAAGRL